jgi:hypothetical protein
MSDQDPTLFSILFNGSHATGAASLFQGVKREMPHLVTGWNDIQLTAVEQAIGNQVAGCFSVTISQVLGQAWSDAQQVREALDPTRTPRHTSKKVPLVTHQIGWATQPKLIVQIDGVTSIDLTYELVLDLELEGAVLTILNGRLCEVSLGTYQGEGKLLINGAEIIKFPTKQWRLPATLRSEKGIPLHRVTEARSDQ